MDSDWRNRNRSLRMKGLKTLKQHQINKAYGALKRLEKMQLPVKAAYSIFMLIKQLTPAYEFELDRERKLLESYHGTMNQDGSIAFETSEDASRFGAEIEELNSLDVDVKIKPVQINFDDLDQQTLTPYDISCLEGFVSFA